ncbi:MAG: class B sortase [Defluviitaleaceae bacterium]|nr:class B sortase [Defluviitaleaceae bacterium]
MEKRLLVLRVLFGIAVVLAVVFTVLLGLNVFREHQGENFFAEIAPEFVPTPDISTIMTTINAEPIFYHENLDPKADNENNRFVTNIDFEQLSTAIPNLVGWIQSYGTNINYPIVQGWDNDFYLHHLPNGTRNPMGSIFMDYRNDPNFLDANTIIYGHDMPRDNKFGSLRHFNSQTYFEQHPAMTIFAPKGNFVAVWFAGYVLDAAFYYPPINFEGYDDFRGFAEDAKSRSVFISDIYVPYGSRLVTLATCTPTGSQSYRFILVGKLVEI